MSAWLGPSCPDVWLNVILGMSMRVSQEEINICVCKLSKADRPTQCLMGEGRVAIQSLKAWIEQKGYLYTLRHRCVCVYPSTSISISIYILLVLFLWKIQTNIDFGTKVIPEEQNFKESFLNRFWSSGIDSLIWLDLKMLKTPFPIEKRALIVYGLIWK